MFDTNIPDTTGDQVIIRFPISPKVRFCTIWILGENRTNETLHFFIQGST